MADEARAFSALISGRVTELGIPRDEVAGRLDVMVSTVEGWLEGTAFPDDDDIERLAGVLRLPRSLLREARRRSIEAVPAPEPVMVTPATLEEPVPLPPPTVEDNEIIAAPERVEAVARATEALTTPWRLFQERIERRRQADRAPTKEASYLEDHRQLATYRARAAMTAGGVILLVLLLRWALGGLGAALGEVWQSLTGAF